MGILTWNNERTLRRCLESVKDFAETIIADGGSTDRTLDIAREHGAVIIQQSEQDKVIEDFALERNREIERATQDWFFYIDSDEVASRELVEEIRRITTAAAPEHLFWEIRMQLAAPGNTKPYNMWKKVYQVRFWNTTIGARMTKRIHEKLRYDKTKYSTGRIDAPWYVPLDDYFHFPTLKKKAHRNARIIEDWRSKNPFTLMRKVWPGILTLIKIWVKRILLEIRYLHHDVLPVRFDVYYSYEVSYILYRWFRRYARNIANLP